MTNQPDFDLWRSAWTSTAPSAAFDIRAAYRKQERRLRARYVGNILAAMVLVAFAAWVLATNPGAEELAWAMVVWLTTLAATAFHVWNWRVLWQTAGATVEDYARICERRCNATLRAVRFGWAFLAVQTTIAASWLTWDVHTGAATATRYGVAMATLAALDAVFAISFTATRRRATQELREIHAFQRER